MLQTQRERAILEHLTREGVARIDDLARRLSVSAETVRRSVKRLERLGSVTRMHGGVQLRDGLAEPSLALRLGVNPDRKRRIAQRMAGLIDNGSSLFLDVGSTTAYVAQALRDHRELFVVTNSLTVAQTLTGRGGNRVFLAGGELRPHDGGVFGAEAVAFARRFRVRHAILTATALDAGAGFMLNDQQEAEFSRAIIDCADQATIVADSTKFDAYAPMRIAPPSAFARLVTDAPPRDALARLLDEAGVAVILA